MTFPFKKVAQRLSAEDQGLPDESMDGLFEDFAEPCPDCGKPLDLKGFGKDDGAGYYDADCPACGTAVHKGFRSRSELPWLSRRSGQVQDQFGPGPDGPGEMSEQRDTSLLERWLAHFPDVAKDWSQATDELPTLAYQLEQDGGIQVPRQRQPLEKRNMVYKELIRKGVAALSDEQYHDFIERWRDMLEQS